MMRTLRLTLTAVAFAAVAACSDFDTPTAVVQPGGPSFDGSGMVGSGNDADSTGTASDSTTITTLGSGMVGSGN